MCRRDWVCACRFSTEWFCRRPRAQYPDSRHVAPPAHRTPAPVRAFGGALRARVASEHGWFGGRCKGSGLGELTIQFRRGGAELVLQHALVRRDVVRSTRPTHRCRLAGHGPRIAAHRPRAPDRAAPWA